MVGFARSSSKLTAALEDHYEIWSALDDAAQSLLKRADPDRAIEIIEDLSAKDDVRNPSAFVAKALHQYPRRRGEALFDPGPGPAEDPAPGPVDSALQRHPEIHDALDEGAIERLRCADSERAVEVIEETASKSHVNNPSAFVVKALTSYPHKRGHHGDIDSLLARHPSIQADLDEAAISKLRGADPARAVEIIEEVLAKGDVRNPSAFVVKALSSYPHKRGSMKDVGQLLARYPEVVDALDEAAILKLEEVDAERAIEIIEDLAAKGDVRNPSAFVAKALQLYPHRRGASSHVPAVRFTPAFAANATYTDRVARVPSVASTVVPPWKRGTAAWMEFARQPARARGADLDEDARRMLRQVEPERATEILRDLELKSDVRNPSAFVVQALRSFPQRRGDPHDVDSVLARCPRVRAALDEDAMQKLREADPARAVEVVQDVAAKTDVHNPSAFVVRALMAHPQKRGQEDPGSWEPLEPLAKRMRPTLGVPPQLGVQRALPPRFRSDPADTLDEQAQRVLAEAHPARAEEILEELAAKGNEVRNASAFVAKALHQFPYPRGRRSS